MKRYGKPQGWKGESHRHYLAAKGVKTKRLDHRQDLARFKEKYRNKPVTKQEFRTQAKKAVKIQFGLDEGKFNPMEFIIPSQKNESEVAKAIFLGVKLRKQNKERLKKAKTPEERERIKKEIKENDKFRGKLKEKQEKVQK